MVSAWAARHEVPPGEAREKVKMLLLSLVQVNGQEVNLLVDWLLAWLFG
jgi:hypothetical protein